MQAVRKIWVTRIVLLAALAFSLYSPWVGLTAFLGWLSFRVGAATYYQSFQGPSLERALGFKVGSTYLRNGRESALSIRTVVDSGVFAAAGFQNGDVLPDWTYTDFFRHLHQNRGCVVELEVVDGNDDGPPFRTRARKAVRFAVPTTATASPSRADILAAILIWSPITFGTMGGGLALFVTRAVWPTCPLWGQILVAFLLANVGCYSGVTIANRFEAKRFRC